MTKIVSLIIAISDNDIVGKDNSLPWDMPADLAYFLKMTQDQSVVIGRKTYEAIGQPMTDRQNIVLTHQKDYEATGCDVVHSFEEAIKVAKSDIFVMGGATAYTTGEPFATKLYLTRIHTNSVGDTSFTPASDWQLESAEHHKKDSKNPFDYSFETYTRPITTGRM